MMKKKNKLSNFGLEIFMIILVSVICIPLWMVFVNSFKPLDEALELGLGFPRQFTLENYMVVFREANALRALINGLIVATSTVIVTIATSSVAGFFFSRSSTRLSKSMYNVFFAGLIIPVAVIPTYLIIFLLKLNNTYIGLILIFITYTLSFDIFLYTGYIKTIPREMDEAAIIDGCGKIRMFFNVIFPLIKPVTVTVLVFNFLGVWNDVQSQLFFASADKWSMPMTVFNFYGKYVAKWNLIFADLIITIVPMFIIYLLAQKYIVDGMTAGAIKS